jgi:predicted Zn finger-like uncharacterized protein
MANIRVTCPTCKTALEVDKEYEGQEVECGNCLQVFVANSASSSSSGSTSSSSTSGSGKTSGSSRQRSEDDQEEAPRPKRRPRRRNDDDDDDYDHDRRRDDDDEDDYRPSRRRGGGDNSLAIASLILGIVAVFPGCCCGLISIPCSLGAIATGAMGMKNEEGKVMSIIGIVLGVLMLVLTVVAISLNLGMGGMNNGRFR